MDKIPGGTATASSVEVGVDWGNGSSVSVYICMACGFETAVLEQLAAHVRSHGATVVRVAPTFFDDVRRG
jgi:hypothetical protein